MQNKENAPKKEARHPAFRPYHYGEDLMLPETFALLNTLPRRER